MMPNYWRLADRDVQVTRLELNDRRQQFVNQYLSG
jgi:hypothetical protein